jgi:hypothetical protein
MYALNGKPGGSGLYSIVNEDGQVRAMALVQSKSHASISPLWQGVAQGLQEHGHPKTQLIYSDNASSECLADLSRYETRPGR